MNTSTPVRALVAGALALLWTLGGAAVPAFSAPDEPGSLGASYAAANAVVIGRVTQVQPEGARTVLRVGVMQSYKGGLDGQVALTAPAAGAQCAVEGVGTGQRMAFFVRESQGRATVDSCTGTRPADAALEKRLARIAERAGEGPDASKPEAATLKRVSFTEPVGFWRMAAPGGAAVILGILGMLVAVRISRR